jgi:hypothetical protein
LWHVAWKPGYWNPNCSLDNALEERLPHNEQQQLGTLHDNDWIAIVVKDIHYKGLQEPT